MAKRVSPVPKSSGPPSRRGSKQVTLDPAAFNVVGQALNTILGLQGKVARATRTGVKRYEQGHTVPRRSDTAYGPSISPQVAKKVAENMLNQGHGGFLHRVEHGVTSLPSTVAHGVARAAPVVAHAVEHEAPAVARAVPKTVKAVYQAVPQGPTVSVDRHGHLKAHVDLGVIPAAGRRTKGGAEGLAAAGVVAGQGGAKALGKLWIGAAGQTAQAVEGVKAVVEGHPFTPPTPQQITAQQVQEAGIAPTEVVQKAGPAALKVLAGGGGAVASLRNPKQAITNVAEGTVASLVGVGLALGAGVEMTDPNTSFADKKAQIKEPLVKVAEAMQQAYGGDVSLEDAFKAGEKNPLFYGGNAWALISGGTSSLAALRNVLELPLGSSIADMARAARAIDVPREPRTLTLGVKGGKPQEVWVPSSKSPAYRTLVSKPYDLTSHMLQASPGLRRLPWAETPRAARALSRQMDRQRRRLPAEAQSIFNQVDAFVHKSGNRHYAAALATLLQKPQGFTDGEWMRAAMEDIRTQLETGRFVGPEGKVSPGVQRLLNRVRRYQTKEEAARTNRLGRASYRVSKEQERIATSLDDINAQRKRLVEERNSLAGDGSKTAEERQVASELYDEQIRALESQRKVAKRELDDLTVNREPVAHPNRDQFQQTLEQIPYFKENPQAIEDAIATVDARAHAWSGQTGRPASEYWGTIDTRLVKPEEIPSDAYNQIAFSLNRTLDPQTAAQNLRRVAGGDLHKPELGLHGNKKRYRTINGQKIPVFGPLTPEEYANRLKVLVPDQAERDRLARWYEQAAPTFERFFGKDAEELLRGFAVSQANASPTFGLTATMRVLDKIRAKEPITKNEISAVVKSIEDAVRGNHVSKGLAAKLHDFADSLEGKTTRTWMGNDPRGGFPAAIDVHASRDLGYIDKKLVARLRNPERGAMFRKGFNENDFVIDSSGRPTGHAYERQREQYQAITDHLNATGFDGRRDWTPSQVQALGWSAIQRLHGAMPEDLGYAVAQNTRRITLEVTRGKSGIGNDLTLGEATQVARSLEPTIHDMVDQIDGLHLDGGVETGISAYEGTPNASLHFNLVGAPPKIRQLVRELSDTFDQYDVWATRESSSTGSKPTLIIAHPDLADPAKAVKLYNELYKANKKKFAGFESTEENGVPAISLIMPGKPVTVAEHDARLGELEPAITDAVTQTLGPVEYHGRLGNTQIISRESKLAKGTDEKLGLEGAGPEGSLLGPHSAEARQRLEQAVADAEAGRPVEVGAPRNQTRQRDILGASQWLGGPEGKRIIYLTENADASTVLHELFGHATEELRQYYPQEFAQVEERVGKPYADWTVADHEQFAGWAEQYFRSGLAPTPELSGVFSRMKTWLRSIYEGLTRELGSRMPTETRVLFDSYFGAYDDENVARIALNMGLEEHGREELGIQRYGGAKVVSQEELRTLKKRVETRRYNRSLDGMVNRLDELTKELDNLRKEQQTWTPGQQDEYTRLSAEVLTQQAEIVVRADKREQALRGKLSDLEKSLQKGTDTEDFQAALENMKWLSQDRERVLRESFGADYDAVFAHRRDLLADWLVSRGLLEPDFQQGTGFYFPHTLDSAAIRTSLKGPAYSLTSNVVGKTKMNLLKLHKRNQMILWQRGDWNADPAVLFEAHFRAMSYDWMNQVKQKLYDVGRPLTYQEAQNLPHDVYLININGTPISSDLRQQLKSAMGTEDAQRVHDGIEGMDNAELESNMKSYWDAFAIDPNQLPAGFDPTQIADLRVVPKSVVHAILRPISGSENPIGKAWDVGTTVARMATIYANVPGYMFANAAGNFGFLLAQQGFRVPMIINDARRLHNNRRLYDRIQAETGEVPLLAQISRGRGFSKHLAKGESKLLHFESAVDRLPRAVAWMHEARKRGYRSDAKMFELLDGKSAKAARDREIVSHNATNHMVDFNRVTPHEQQTLTRGLFIWPWVRGATAWPFWYAKNYPVRAAVGANIGLAETQRQQQMLGAVPPWYQSLYPVSRRGERAQVINTGPISPTGTAASSLQLIGDTVASLLGRKPSRQTAALVGSFNPLLKDAVSIATHKDQYGQDQSLLDTFKGSVTDIVPGWRIVKALRDSSSTPRVFRKYDRGLQDRTLRTFVRIAPETVTVPWLNAQAYSPGQMSTSEKIAQSQHDEMKAWETIGKGKPFPNFLRRAATMKVVYEDRLTVYAKQKQAGPNYVPANIKSISYNPSPYEQAKVLYAVVKQYYPAATQAQPGKPAHVPPPESILAAYADNPDVGFAPKPDSAAGRLVMEKYLSTVERAFFGAASKATSNAAKKIQAGKVEKQKSTAAATKRRAELSRTG